MIQILKRKRAHCSPSNPPLIPAGRRASLDKNSFLLSLKSMRELENLAAQTLKAQVPVLTSFSFFKSEMLSFEPSKDLLVWSRKVKILFGFSCILSGEKNVVLNSHHLFSKRKFPSLEFYYLNGVPIRAEYHRLFQSLYSYNTTIDDFITFLDFFLLLKRK